MKRLICIINNKKRNERIEIYINIICVMRKIAFSFSFFIF